MKNTKVISAFPGCGKTYCYNKYKDSEIKILDSDSSEFSWIKDSEGKNTKERNPEFPNNYIEHIKDNMGEVDIIFISSHDIVRAALKEAEIKYFMVYPDKYYKEEFLQRYINRGDNEGFIDFIDINFDNFIDDMMKEDFPHKIVLLGSETMDDIIKYGYCGSMSCNSAWNKYGCAVKCENCNHVNRIVE